MQTTNSPSNIGKLAKESLEGKLKPQQAKRFRSKLDKGFKRKNPFEIVDSDKFKKYKK